MKKLIIIISLLLLFKVTVFGQSNLDSSWAVWEDLSQADTLRAEALLDFISEGCFYTNPDSAQAMIDQLYAFNQHIDYKRGMADALNLAGYNYFRLGDYPKALETFQSGLELSEEINYQKVTADILLKTGFIYHDNEDIITALKYYERSLKIFEALNDLDGIGSVYNEYGSIYRTKGEYAKALDYYLKGIAINKQIDDEIGNSAFYSNIGGLYLDQKDLPKALEYTQKGLLISEQIGDKVGIAIGLASIGNIYSEQGDYEKALEKLQQSLVISDEIDNLLGSSTTLLDMGIIYGRTGRQAESIKYCEKSRALARLLGDIGNQESACACLYDAYKARGNKTKALDYLELMMALTDSLQNEETAIELKQMEFQQQLLADSLIQVEKDLMVEMAHQTEVRNKNKNRNLAIGFSIFFLALAGGFFSRWRYVRKSKAIIEKERDRSESLLLNILPAEIAEELKEKGEAAARDFEMASILFTDFKGFTEKSEKLSATELIKEVNHCFRAFDHICEKYGVEKIKTIGDAYMAAGGLPVPSDNSIQNTVLAALEMQSFMIDRIAAKRAKNEIAFDMRLGIHTGPVVAGIVGVKKFQYDIWGDTVNTAARMESSGEIGKVNVSDATYQLLKNNSRFAFEERGEITAKGKGKMKMWFVETRPQNPEKGTN